MPRRSLLDELKVRPLLCDGAMGTQLLAAGMQPGECGELWNVQRPDAVTAIHRNYADAGCDLIMTNTFGGTSASLLRHGFSERVAELNLAGARVARAAAGEARWVLGDVGPFGGFLEPLGDTTPAELLEIFRQQMTALREGGTDAVIVETMVDPGEVTTAIRAARAVAADWPVLATYTFKPAGDAFRTVMGTTVDEALGAAVDAGASIVGSNCGTGLGLDDYLRLAADLVKASRGTPVILQPNAGAPQFNEGVVTYPATPQDMAAIVPRLLDIGVRVIGGCCGTTPAHLKAMSAALRAK